MVHYVLGKRKVVLDQIRNGLKTLDVLEQITLHPDFYKSLFTAQEEYSYSQVLDKMLFKEGSCQVLVDNIKRFITTALHPTLKSFVKYVTGSSFLPRKNMFIAFYSRNGFFAATCSFKLDCPVIEQYDEFSRALSSAIVPSKAHFTSV